MDEPFALIFSPHDKPVEYWDDDWSPEYVERIRDILSDLDNRENLQVLQGANGYGADAVTVVVILTGLATLFLKGKSIQENFDAWVSIGRRIKKRLTQLRHETGEASVSQPAALALAIHRLVEDDPELRIRTVVASHCLPVYNGSIGAQDSFMSQPDRYYVFLLEAESDDIFLVSMRSTGLIEVVQRLHIGNWFEYRRLK